MEYTFTLKYQLSDQAEISDELIGRLATAGCDDALIGLGIPGRIALEFIREAPSAQQAMESALQQVSSVLKDARLFEVSPDYVGLTEVADLIGVTRQNMRKLMLAHYLTFPAPVHEGVATIWHLSDVLAWLANRGGYRIPANVQEAAAAALNLNLSKEIKRHRVLPDTP
ncbi:helix-turn-helix transcriptional regulator [Erwinia sorbitola]|uniref:DNA-binding protein n=1 Tax=Erwinia sorbitola TaxID=2681984 RepID=A0A6I6EA56_9GAMM|nr:DNA-binding protein [Erwinia sorbitola]MTD28566.1 DNA-binding protein [Erwinia sorbitola]QGU86674.1 DNA-binding protein [Erwinia sorbitola]